MLIWHLGCQEQKLLIRENMVMRYFFLFVLLDNLVVTSSLSRQVSGSSTILSPPVPCPPRNPPSSPLLTPRWALLPVRQAALPWAPGPARGGLPPCGRSGVCSFCCFVFSQHENRERSQDQLTNRYEAKRQRDSDLEAGHQKDGVGVGGCPGARPLHGWNQVSSHSLTLG